MKLFPAVESLECVAIDLLVPLGRTARGKIFIRVITAWSSKVARHVPLRNTKAAPSTGAFLKQ